MSTSGVYTWTMQLQDFVNAALRKLSVLSGGQFPQTYEVTAATQALNAMLLAFQADGMPIWNMFNYSFVTVPNQQTYSIGLGQTLSTPAPLKIVQAWRSTAGQANVPMNIYTNYNYNLLPQTAGPATPVNFYYQPGEQAGIIQIWPQPLDNSNTITFRYQRPFQDTLSPTDEIDFPKYWYEAVIYGLADRLAPEYGIPLPDRKDFAQLAMAYKQQALSFGTEEGSMYWQPDWVGQ